MDIVPRRVERRSRAYLLGIALGLPSITAVWVAQAETDAFVRFAYPLLAAYLATAAFVLVRYPRSVRSVERRTFEIVTVLWLGRMAAELFAGDPVEGWRHLTPWSFMTLPLLAALGYVVHDTRTALRRTSVIPAVSGVLGLLMLGPEALATGETGYLVELLRYEVYLAVTMVFVHALALHKDDAAASQLEAERLRIMAHHDPLTGLPNRRRLQDALQRGLATADAAGQPLSVVVFDLDRFKSVNDDHGHAVGDDVLCEVAAAASNETRPRDVVGRWGGEEFLVVLPGADQERALRVAERMRQAVAERTAAKGVPVTASFGVAQHRPGAAPEDLIAEADAMLYAAKADGRDRVRATPVPAARPPTS